MRNKVYSDATQKKQRYATRKLKVGMVSLLMGFTFVFGSTANIPVLSSSYASELTSDAETQENNKQNLVGVENLSILSNAEKDKVMAEIIRRNPDIKELLKADETIRPDVATYRESIKIDGDKIIITLKDKTNREFNKSDYIYIYAGAEIKNKVEVKDTNKLTETEKDTIKYIVEKNNPGATEIEVADNGKVTFIDAQGEKRGYSPEQIITGESKRDDEKYAGELFSFINGRTARVFGYDRAETAVKVSRIAYPNGADTVIIANGESFPDILSAMPYGKAIKAPVLYVNQDSIPKKTDYEINKLECTRLILIGGDDTISRNVERKLSKQGFAIDRIDGADRYQTSEMIAKRLRYATGKDNNDVIVANGKIFPDALSISPMAMDKQIPILLSHKDHMSEYTKEALKDLSKGKVYIVGGESTIDSGVEAELKTYAKNGIERFGGEDRYDTSRIITEKMNPNAAMAIYASGQIFPDALVASELADYYQSPILLLKKDSIPSSISNYVEKSGIYKGIVVGGKNTINDNVVGKL